MGKNEDTSKRQGHRTKCLNKKLKVCHISNLLPHPNTLEQKETTRKKNRRQEMIRLRAEINGIETTGTKQTNKQNNLMSWFF